MRYTRYSNRLGRTWVIAADGEYEVLISECKLPLFGEQRDIQRDG